MSVWVEISCLFLSVPCQDVTLHVSVWVEMSIQPSTIFAVSSSRSTWACELKWCSTFAKKSNIRSRSTWACELKLKSILTAIKYSCHAPRERVSWNLQGHATASNWNCHAPRERVSWNLFYCSTLDFLFRHAPRERVSWNIGDIGFNVCTHVTLHVSVWVEILVKPLQTQD